MNVVTRAGKGFPVNRMPRHEQASPVSIPIDGLIPGLRPAAEGLHEQHEPTHAALGMIRIESPDIHR